MKNNKNIFAGIMLTGFLASCGNQALDIVEQTNINSKSRNNITSKEKNIEPINEISNNEVQTNEVIINEYNSNSEEKIIISDSESKELTINEKCIGCGHCVRFAVENFKMSGHKAIVISQDNLGSAEVSKAISRCPVDAISIG